LVSQAVAASSAEWSWDRPPFSFVRGQDSTMWDIVWVSPQEHRSVSVDTMSFYRHCNALDRCGNGSGETTVVVVG